MPTAPQTKERKQITRKCITQILICRRLHFLPHIAGYHGVQHIPFLLLKPAKRGQNVEMAFTNLLTMHRASQKVVGSQSSFSCSVSQPGDFSSSVLPYVA